MIGKRVKDLCQERNMSLSELAEKAGVAKSYLSSIERNIQTNPSIQFLEKIARVLNVTTDYFLQDSKINKDELDPEWLRIIEEAMQSGISKEQFRKFIEFNKRKRSQK